MHSSVSECSYFKAFEWYTEEREEWDKAFDHQMRKLFRISAHWLLRRKWSHSSRTAYRSMRIIFSLSLSPFFPLLFSIYYNLIIKFKLVAEMILNISLTNGEEFLLFWSKDKIISQIIYKCNKLNFFVSFYMVINCYIIKYYIYAVLIDCNKLFHE